MGMIVNSLFRGELIMAAVKAVADRGETPWISVFTANKEYIGTREFEQANGFTTFNIAGHAVRGFDVDYDLGVMSFNFTSKGLGFTAKVPLLAISSVFSFEKQEWRLDMPYVGFNQAAPQEDTEKPVKKAFKPRLIKGGKKDGEDD